MDFFNSPVHSWYSLYKRDLPWRNTRNPYLIWLSEIILQQTRIDQGMAYYSRFAAEFPTISDLADAPEDQILKLWQGLGYYSRARNLHFTAKFIQQNYNGIFPDNYNTIRSLKGIGEYTAAAIASISFNLEYPTVDGNVYRVLSRFFGIADPIDTSSGKKTFNNLAIELIKGVDPGMHNQAIMEFGALQCTPKGPNCNQCPLKERCFAFLNQKITELPVKQNKTKQRDRHFNYLVLSHRNHTWIRKREGKDIWKNLFEFPFIETEDEISIEKLTTLTEFDRIISTTDQAIIENVSDWKIHILSHQRIHYRFVRIQLTDKINGTEDFIRVNKEDIFNFAVPKLLETYLNEYMKNV
ncbi:A/G-specific adenine glycosylase [Aquipluma nitroreducens]|uniref:Adenine DNA glycosylase n=1 Tax=Aquipluma nitroreducens TaxID=2010828 RepID=A0A5K7SBZ0_9BACT|nr:A/G-specific adenine glycosylase [Aquipluma nitroreducens]BBE19078.1 A/G-specific adenine glycosylase [Aquipluma nitroreducens]